MLEWNRERKKIQKAGNNGYRYKNQSEYNMPREKLITDKIDINQ